MEKFKLNPVLWITFLMITLLILALRFSSLAEAVSLSALTSL